MVVFAVGLAVLVLGVVGIIVWGNEFVYILKGTIPAMLILGGALAAYLGFEEIKDKGKEDVVGDDRSDLQQEVESLKEEIKGLKEEKTEQE